MPNKGSDEMSFQKSVLRKMDAITAISALQATDFNRVADTLRMLGFTYKETSIVTGIPEGTLKSRESRKHNESKTSMEP